MASASERDEWLRAAWQVMVTEEIDARRLEFVDEMGTNTSLALIHEGRFLGNNDI